MGNCARVAAFTLVRCMCDAHVWGLANILRASWGAVGVPQALRVLQRPGVVDVRAGPLCLSLSVLSTPCHPSPPGHDQGHT